MPSPPRLLRVDGVERTLAEWAAASGVPIGTIRARLDLFGWDPARAVRTPPDRRFARGGRPARDAVRPTPALKRHAGGQAYCRWRSAGSTLYRYFGPWGSTEAKAAYRRFAVEWADGLAEVRSAGSGLTVAELALAYLRWADGYYRKDGKPTGELPIIRAALGELADWCGEKVVADIRKADVEGLQSQLAGRLARTTANKYVARIRRLFEWGAGEEGVGGRPLVPANVAAVVGRVRGLKRGRSAAREPGPKAAVPWADLAATLPFLSPDRARREILTDAILVQWLAGMRPGETLAMRPADLDRKPAEWRYAVPGGGKNVHRGAVGVYWLGPRAQQILSAYLGSCPADRPIFALPPRTAGGRWVRPGRDYYRRAVAVACKKAGIPHWHPHQIRHSRATEIGTIYESDKMAAEAIGASEDVAREVYRDRSDAARRRIARQLG